MVSGGLIPGLFTYLLRQPPKRERSHIFWPRGGQLGYFLHFFIGDETYGCNGINKDSMERDIIGAEWVFLSERFR